jgi:hypothetical protein
LRALEHLDLTRCSGLRSLPHYSPAKFPRLRHVCLIGCSELLASKPNLDDIRRHGVNVVTQPETQPRTLHDYHDRTGLQPALHWINDRLAPKSALGKVYNTFPNGYNSHDHYVSWT